MRINYLREQRLGWLKGFLDQTHTMQYMTVLGISGLFIYQSGRTNCLSDTDIFDIMCLGNEGRFIMGNIVGNHYWVAEMCRTLNERILKEMN